MSANHPFLNYGGDCATCNRTEFTPEHFGGSPHETQQARKQRRDEIEQRRNRQRQVDDPLEMPIHLFEAGVRIFTDQVVETCWLCSAPRDFHPSVPRFSSTAQADAWMVKMEEARQEAHRVKEQRDRRMFETLTLAVGKTRRWE